MATVTTLSRRTPVQSLSVHVDMPRWYEPRIPRYTQADLDNRDLVPLELLDLRKLFPHLTGSPVKIPCRWHRDKNNPSLGVFRRNLWCFTCRKSMGGFDAIHALCGTHSRAETFAIARHLLGEPENARIPVWDLPPIAEDELRPYKRGMQIHLLRRQWLTQKYGLHEAAQDALEIGHSGRAFAFPVRALDDGRILNIRFRRDPKLWPDLVRPADLPPDAPFEQLARYFGKGGRTTPMWYTPTLRGPSLYAALMEAFGRPSVVLVEGEMDAGALTAELGLPAVTVTNGCTAWKSLDIDLGFLHGCTVAVMYDNDQGGIENGAEVTRALKGLGITAKEVRIPHSTGCKDAGDLVAKGWTRDQVLALIRGRN